MKAKVAGFTMTELLVTLAIMGIIISVALPPLTSFVEDRQLSSNTGDLLVSLLLARSEATARNSSVSICKIAPSAATTCDNTESWQSGWIAFVDLDSDGVKDAGETVLDTFTGMNSNTVVSSTNFANFISYRPSGVTNTNGIITICVNNRIAKDLVINATGRPRIADSTCP